MIHDDKTAPADDMQTLALAQMLVARAFALVGTMTAGANGPGNLPNLALNEVGTGTAFNASAFAALGALHSALTTEKMAQIGATSGAVTDAALTRSLRAQFIADQFYTLFNDAFEAGEGEPTDAARLTIPGAMQLWYNVDTDGKKRAKIRIATSMTDAMTAVTGGTHVTADDGPAFDAYATSLVAAPV